MSYLVLARKYRPKAFAEVCGQEVTTRILRGAIESERIGHAYLFTGPRGTGKTTSARLFAKALNCEHGPQPEPCGKCERCISADAGSEADIVEIDAASNTGVDFVRDLRDSAAYVPLRARFKVYIIDEVHMLSRSAFNALLKTLEEPPPHVKFLFATTEPHKVPDTILSRCQVLRLSPISEDAIEARLDEIFQLENVQAEPGTTAELARRARGGMRDALSMADQLLALVGTEPKLGDLDRLSSEGSTRAVADVVKCMLADDQAALLGALPTVQGSEAEFLSSLLDYLRSALVAALCGPDAPMLAGSDEQKRALAGVGKDIGARRLELWLQELLIARDRMRLLPSHARLTLEVTLLELSHPESTLPLAELVERLAALEGRAASGAAAAPPASAQAPSQAVAARSASETRSASNAPAAAAQRPASQRSAEPAPARDAAVPSKELRPAVRTNSTRDAWVAFLAELKTRAAALASVLERKGQLVQYGAGRASVKFKNLSDEERALIGDRRNQRMCSRTFSDVVQKTVEVVLEDAAQARPGGQDPFTQKVADMFEGNIED